jgi:hypothetical protein
LSLSRTTFARARWMRGDMLVQRLTALDLLRRRSRP